MLPPASLTKLIIIPESAGSRALWLYLKECQIPFVVEKVSADRAPQKCADLASQEKASGTIILPVLREQGVILYGNVTVLRYVGTKYLKWYPADVAARAAVDMYLEWHQTHLHKASATLLELTTPAPAGIFSPMAHVRVDDDTTTTDNPDDGTHSDQSSSSTAPSTVTPRTSDTDGDHTLTNSGTTTTSTSTTTTSSAASSSSAAAAASTASDTKKQQELSAETFARVKQAELAYLETLELMEHTFLKTSHFLAGGQITIADVAAACELAFIELTPAAWKDFPRLQAWFDRVTASFNYWSVVSEPLSQWIPVAKQLQTEQRKKQEMLKRYGKDAAGGTRPPDIDHRAIFYEPLSEVYNMFLSGEALSKRTSTVCSIDAKRGGQFSFFDGQVTGTVLVLIENISIVKSWRHAEWPQNAGSTLKITFSALEPEVTEVIVHQSDVPGAFMKKTDEWWHTSFWTPLGGVLLRSISHTTYVDAATPHMLYELLMDVNRVSKYTKTKCDLNRGVGASFSLLDNQVTGKNGELVTDKKITQSWRMADWPASHYSTVVIEFQRVPGGTDVSFKQSNVPFAQWRATSDLWEKYFWRKIRREVANNYEALLTI